MQKFTALGLIISILFSFVPHFGLLAQVGESESESEIVGGGVRELISIVVQKSVLDEMPDLISRFAGDVSRSTGMRALVVEVGPDDSSYDIFRGNSRLYHEGEFGDFKSKLKGTILVGDIPVPVVQDGKKTKESIWPYRDLEDVEYVYDVDSDTWASRGGDGVEEIWHGWINLPGGMGSYRNYFARNHAFHTGQKVFENEFLYVDLPREVFAIPEDVENKYNLWLSHVEDLAYFRFGESLLQDIWATDEFDFADVLDASALSGETAASFFSIPDFWSPTLLGAYMGRYSDVLENRLTDLYLHTDQAGHWSPEQVQTLISWISARDESAVADLKAWNTNLEKEIYAAIESSGIARDISVPKKTTVVREVESGGDDGGTETIIEEKSLYWNGVLRDQLTVGSCSLLRGILPDVAHPYAQLVEANRAYNPETVNDGQCQNRNEPGYLKNDSAIAEGCCAKNLSINDDGVFSAPGCNLGSSWEDAGSFFYHVGAQRPVFDISATEKVLSGVAGAIGCGGILTYNESDKFAQTFNSLQNHVEPTLETIQAQSAAESSRKLPVDDARGFSFYGHDREFYRVAYPNVFDVYNQLETREAKRQKLEEILENTRNEINVIALAGQNHAAAEFARDRGTSSPVTNFPFEDRTASTCSYKASVGATSIEWTPDIQEIGGGGEDGDSETCKPSWLDHIKKTYRPGNALPEDIFDRVPIDSVLDSVEWLELSLEEKNKAAFSALFAKNKSYEGVFLRSMDVDNTQIEMDFGTVSTDFDPILFAAEMDSKPTDIVPEPLGAEAGLDAVFYPVDTTCVDMEPWECQLKSTETATINISNEASLVSTLKSFYRPKKRIAPTSTQKLAVENEVFGVQIGTYRNFVTEVSLGREDTLVQVKALGAAAEYLEFGSGDRVSLPEGKGLIHISTKKPFDRKGIYQVEVRGPHTSPVLISFEVVDQGLFAQTTRGSVRVADSDGVQISGFMIGKNGQVDTDFHESVSFSSDWGRFSSGSIVAKDGFFSTTFYPGSRAGKATILVESADSLAYKVPITIIPDKPDRIVEIQPKHWVENTPYRFYPRLVDRFGNAIDLTNYAVEWSGKNITIDQVRSDHVVFTGPENSRIKTGTLSVEIGGVSEKFVQSFSGIEKLNVEILADNLGVGRDKPSELLLDLGQPYTGAGNISFDRSDLFQSVSQVNFSGGKAKVYVHTGTLAGKGNLILSIGGEKFVHELVVHPGEADRIGITKTDTNFVRVGEKETGQLSVYDKYGNRVPFLFSTIRGKASELSKGIVSDLKISSQGLFSFSVADAGIGGIVFDHDDLAPATWTFRAVKDVRKYQNLGLDASVLMGVSVEQKIPTSENHREIEDNVARNWINQGALSALYVPADIPDAQTILSPHEYWGFGADFKSFLLLGAGNFSGKLLGNDLEDVIVYGDPTVRIKPDKLQQKSVAGGALGFWIDSFETSPDFLETGRIESDEFTDLFVGIGNEMWGFYGSSDPHDFWERGPLVRSLENIKKWSVLDLNQDGFTEIISLDDSGKMKIYENQEGLYLPQSLDFEIDSKDFFVGDFDRDPHPDLLVLDNAHRLYFVFGRENGFFVPQLLDDLGPAMPKISETYTGVATNDAAERIPNLFGSLVSFPGMDTSSEGIRWVSDGSGVSEREIDVNFFELTSGQKAFEPLTNQTFLKASLNYSAPVAKIKPDDRLDFVLNLIPNESVSTVDFLLPIWTFLETDLDSFISSRGEVEVVGIREDKLWIRVNNLQKLETVKIKFQAIVQGFDDLVLHVGDFDGGDDIDDILIPRTGISQPENWIYASAKLTASLNAISPTRSPIVHKLYKKNVQIPESVEILDEAGFKETLMSKSKTGLPLVWESTIGAGIPDFSPQSTTAKIDRSCQAVGYSEVFMAPGIKSVYEPPNFYFESGGDGAPVFAAPTTKFTSRGPIPSVYPANSAGKLRGAPFTSNFRMYSLPSTTGKVATAFCSGNYDLHMVRGQWNPNCSVIPLDVFSMPDFCKDRQTPHQMMCSASDTTEVGDQFFAHGGTGAAKSDFLTFDPTVKKLTSNYSINAVDPIAQTLQRQFWKINQMKLPRTTVLMPKVEPRPKIQINSNDFEKRVKIDSKEEDAGFFNPFTTKKITKGLDTEIFDAYWNPKIEQASNDLVSLRPELIPVSIPQALEGQKSAVIAQSSQIKKDFESYMVNSNENIKAARIEWRKQCSSVNNEICDEYLAKIEKAEVVLRQNYVVYFDYISDVEGYVSTLNYGENLAEKIVEYQGDSYRVDIDDFGAKGYQSLVLENALLELKNGDGYENSILGKNEKLIEKINQKNISDLAKLQKRSESFNREEQLQLKKIGMIEKRYKKMVDGFSAKYATNKSDRGGHLSGILKELNSSPTLEEMTVISQPNMVIDNSLTQIEHKTVPVAASIVVPIPPVRAIVVPPDIRLGSLDNEGILDREIAQNPKVMVGTPPVYSMVNLPTEKFNAPTANLSQTPMPGEAPNWQSQFSSVTDSLEQNMKAYQKVAPFMGRLKTLSSRFPEWNVSNMAAAATAGANLIPKDLGTSNHVSISPIPDQKTIVTRTNAESPLLDIEQNNTQLYSLARQSAGIVDRVTESAKFSAILPEFINANFVEVPSVESTKIVQNEERLDLVWETDSALGIDNYGSRLSGTVSMPIERDHSDICAPLDGTFVKSPTGDWERFLALDTAEPVRVASIDTENFYFLLGNDLYLKTSKLDIQGQSDYAFIDWDFFTGSHAVWGSAFVDFRIDGVTTLIDNIPTSMEVVVTDFYDIASHFWQSRPIVRRVISIPEMADEDYRIDVQGFEIKNFEGSGTVVYPSSTRFDTGMSDRLIASNVKVFGVGRRNKFALEIPTIKGPKWQKIVIKGGEMVSIPSGRMRMDKGSVLIMDGAGTSAPIDIVNGEFVPVGTAIKLTEGHLDLVIDEIETPIEAGMSVLLQNFTASGRFNYPLPVGNYFAVSRFFDETKRVASRAFPLWNIDSSFDVDGPSIHFVGGDQVFGTFGQKSLIDATGTFDNSELVDVFWDFDTSIDSDNDGDSTNDRDFPARDSDVSKLHKAIDFLKIKYPLPAIGESKELKLHVTDARGNISSETVSVSTKDPVINLHEVSIRGRSISGFIEDISTETPISVYRRRHGLWKKVIETETLSTGDFKLSDLAVDSGFLIEDLNGTIVAEVPDRGRINLLDLDMSSRWSFSGENQIIGQEILDKNGGLVGVLRYWNNGDKPVKISLEPSKYRGVLVSDLEIEDRYIWKPVNENLTVLESRGEGVLLSIDRWGQIWGGEGLNFRSIYEPDCEGVIVSDQRSDRAQICFPQDGSWRLEQMMER